MSLSLDGGARVLPIRCLKALAEQLDDGDGRSEFTTPATMEVIAFNRSFNEADFTVWEKIGAVAGLSYGIGIYGAMAAAGRFICSMTRIDFMWAFRLSLYAILEGLGYAAPPMMALLFILDISVYLTSRFVLYSGINRFTCTQVNELLWFLDEVVKLSPHARAMRDVEDENFGAVSMGCHLASLH